MRGGDQRKGRNTPVDEQARRNLNMRPALNGDLDDGHGVGGGDGGEEGMKEG